MTQQITDRRSAVSGADDEEEDDSWDDEDSDDAKEVFHILQDVQASFVLVSKEDQKGFNEVLASMSASVTASMSISMSQSMIGSMLPSLSEADKANLDQFIKDIKYKKGDEITDKIVEACFEETGKNRKNFCNYIGRGSNLITIVNKVIALKDSRWTLEKWQSE
ncbi:hypothetical protein JKY79_00865 [Candidatus Babeliales bacterium]|nr:hypothetical protein [Candidatus Babeliales bacterium]